MRLPPRMGGAFGTKQPALPEQPDRPVKIADLVAGIGTTWGRDSWSAANDGLNADDPNRSPRIASGRRSAG